MYQDISGVLPVSVVRKSRSGDTLVLKMSDDTYRTFNSTMNEFVGEPYESLSDIQNVGRFLRVSDENSAALVASIAPEAEDVTVTEPQKLYRVPSSISKEITLGIFSLRGELSPEDYEKASALASGEPVDLDTVSWINSHFTSHDPGDMVRGGFKGRKWAEKILSGEGMEDEVGYDPYAKYRFDDGNEDFDYMAIGPDDDSTLVDRLLRVDWSDGSVRMWTATGFEPLTDTDVEGFDYPYVCPVDPESAGVIARWLDENPYDLYDPADADPEARNLFDTAYDDMDFEQVERVSSVLADASGYTPAERSLNARRQVRGFHGRFGGRQVKQTSKLKAYRKGKLSGEPPIDPTPGKTIKSWLADHDTVTAAATPKQGRSQNIAQPAADPVGKAQASADKTKQLVGEQANEAKEDDKVGGLDDAVYFAIVDTNDSTAVLDVIAITRTEDGQPEAWRRVKGEWKGDPDTLAKLMGATPPAVVQLNEPKVLKAVLQQVDFTDENPGKLPTDAVTDEAPPSIQASGDVISESNADTIDDVEALKAYVALLDIYGNSDPEPEVKSYLRRRAKAFNRIDVIPASWRVPTLAERGMELASESPLMGEYGEVLVAAGHPVKGARGADKLLHYWCYGKGAVKIRWGTKGDLSRAHRHLAKFVGPDRAWGLAERYHEHVFGMSNTKHDKMTGQYVSHHHGK